MIEYLEVLIKLTYDKAMREHIMGYRPVAMCVVKDIANNRILMIKSARFSEAWSLPQEGFDVGEDVEVSSIRCLSEELGLSINKVNFRRSLWMGRIRFDEDRKNERNLPYSLRGMVGKSYFAAYIDSTSDVKFVLNKSEVVAAQWFETDAILDVLQSQDTPKKTVIEQAIKNMS